MAVVRPEVIINILAFIYGFGFTFSVVMITKDPYVNWKLGRIIFLSLFWPVWALVILLVEVADRIKF